MKVLLGLVLVSLLSCEDVSAFQRAHSFRREPMISVLDSMQKYMTGGGQFDRGLYSKLKSCMKMLGPQTDDTQNMIFQGLIDYWDMNGVETDRWGSHKNGYVENNLTVTDLKGMKIKEPCNTASNVAYYFTLLELCNAGKTKKIQCLSKFGKPILRSIAYLMPSSYFHHASSTTLGISLDLKIIDIISYLLHQASVSGIPYDPLIHDLSDTRRVSSSIEIANKIENMYLMQHVSEWKSTVDTIDVPSRYRTIGAMVVTSFAFSVNPIILRLIAPPLARSFGLSEEDYNFLFDKFLPKIVDASSKLGKYRKRLLFKDTIASFSKFGYAFLWFSDAGTEVSRGVFGSVLNFMGSFIMPVLNFKMNILNSYDYNFASFQHGKDVFPGEKRCNRKYPHTKWHVQSAIAIVDAVKLANDLCSVTN